MSALKSASTEETKKIAAEFAEKITQKPQRAHACIIELLGDLGAGKTTFIQGFARALGITRRITSPTFLIMKRYPLKHTHYKNLYHLDAYRMAHIRDLEPLGIKEVLTNPENIVLIEWANNLKGIRLKKSFRLTFRHGKKENERNIVIK